eukprot:4446336-Prymnesium_polylepis.1
MASAHSRADANLRERVNAVCAQRPSTAVSTCQWRVGKETSRAPAAVTWPRTHGDTSQLGGSCYPMEIPVR